MKLYKGTMSAMTLINQNRKRMTEVVTPFCLSRNTSARTSNCVKKGQLTTTAVI